MLLPELVCVLEDAIEDLSVWRESWKLSVAPLPREPLGFGFHFFHQLVDKLVVYCNIPPRGRTRNPSLGQVKDFMLELLGLKHICLTLSVEIVL